MRLFPSFNTFIEIGPLSIQWYALCILTGAAIAYFIGQYNFKKLGYSKEILSDYVFGLLFVGIIGARIWYVIFMWNELYASNPMEIFMINHGGLAIQGGIFTGLLYSCFFFKKRDIPFLIAGDAIMPGVLIAQACGRWGNFFNSEAHGGPTDLPWAVIVNGQGVHPTFLYESLWCLLLCVFLMLMSRNIKFSGQIFCMYAVLYSVERFFVEGLRTDSLMIGPFRQAQVLSLSLIVIFAVIYILLDRRSKRI